MHRRISVGACAIVIAACAPHEEVGRSQPDTEEAIARVESGLSTRYQPKGEPDVRWSLEERMAHYKVPGVSIAVMADGRIEWAKGYGVRNAGEGAPVDADTAFQAASLSKPVTSLGVLRLVDKGRLSLDKPVNDGLQSWKVSENSYTARSEVTLRLLLSHRAGANVHGFAGYAAGADIPSTVQVLKGEPPANSPAVQIEGVPGESYRYSGGGFMIAQLVVEDATGEGFAEVMRREALEPAGMTRSWFGAGGGEPNAACGHGSDGDAPLAGCSHIYPELAAAGLWSTPSDLLKLSSKLVAARSKTDQSFLSAASAQEIAPPDEAHHGLGFGLNGNDDGLALVHSGANAGFRARWISYADGRGGAAVMANSDAAGPLIREILAAVGHVYGWSQDAAILRDVVPLDRDWMQGLTGAYAFGSAQGDPVVRITLEEEGLWIEAPFFARSRMYPASRTAFFTPDGFDLVLETNADGAPASILINGEARIFRVSGNDKSSG